MCVSCTSYLHTLHWNVIHASVCRIGGAGNYKGRTGHPIPYNQTHTQTSTHHTDIHHIHTHTHRNCTSAGSGGALSRPLVAVLTAHLERTSTECVWSMRAPRAPRTTAQHPTQHSGEHAHKHTHFPHTYVLYYRAQFLCTVRPIAVRAHGIGCISLWSLMCACVYVCVRFRTRRKTYTCDVGTVPSGGRRVCAPVPEYAHDPTHSEGANAMTIPAGWTIDGCCVGGLVLDAR